MDKTNDATVKWFYVNGTAILTATIAGFETGTPVNIHAVCVTKRGTMLFSITRASDGFPMIALESELAQH